MTDMEVKMKKISAELKEKKKLVEQAVEKVKCILNKMNIVDSFDNNLLQMLDSILTKK